MPQLNWQKLRILYKTKFSWQSHWRGIIHFVLVRDCTYGDFDRLQQEVHEIRESVRVLKEKLRVAENALVRLLKTKQTLEHDISVSVWRHADVTGRRMNSLNDSTYNTRRFKTAKSKKKKYMYM